MTAGFSGGLHARARTQALSLQSARAMRHIGRRIPATTHSPGGWDGGRAELLQVGVAGSRDALDRMRSSGHAAVLRVSSGGSISTAAGQVLGTAPALTIKLNMLIRNNAVTDVCRQPQAPQAVELRRVAAPRRAGGFGCGLVTCV